MWTHQDVWEQLISGMYASTNEMLSPLSVCTRWGHEGMHRWLGIICTAFTSPLTPYVFGLHASRSASCRSSTQALWKKASIEFAQLQAEQCR